jgi:hypothetical protein
MTRIVKRLGIRCPTCEREGVHARRLAQLEVLDDGTLAVWLEHRDRNRSRDPDERAAQDAGLQLMRRSILDAGARVEVPCGRKHGGQPGTLVIDDAAVQRALEQAGGPFGLRRLTADDLARIASDVWPPAG